MREKRFDNGVGGEDDPARQPYCSGANKRYSMLMSFNLDDQLK